VERFHKALRAKFLTGKSFASIEDAQAQLDTWVRTYNYQLPFQSFGMAVPWDRFKLVKAASVEPVKEVVAEPATVPTVTRRVAKNGLISCAAASDRAGVWLAGENVTVICDGGLVHLHHRGVMIATHAGKHRVDKQRAGLRRGVSPPKTPRPSATAASVTRKVDGTALDTSPGLRAPPGVARAT
jgi:hypothetical protein